MDGDALRVQVACQLFGIDASLDIGDLRGGKGYHFVVLVAAEERVEVVEVTSRRAHDDGFDWHALFSLWFCYVIARAPFAFAQGKLRARLHCVLSVWQSPLWWLPGIAMPPRAEGEAR